MDLTGLRKLATTGWTLTHDRVLLPAYKKMIPWPAYAYRTTALNRVAFVAVTGSCGKTTTKEFIAAVLATRFTGRRNRGNRNYASVVTSTILRVRPWDEYCVLEMAAAYHGERIALEGPLRLVRPLVGVVTNIESDHISAFGSVEAIAEEKGKLIASLPQEGTAVLNADDPRVLAMRDRSVARVLTYGTGPDAMVRAEGVTSRWPGRLSFTVRYGADAYEVKTQLCGEYLTSCVLSALAVGIAMGVPLEAAVAAVEAVRPFPRRMQAVQRKDGVTFIRDDFKAPLWSIPATLQFMRDADATRKIVVIGTISDFRGSSNRAIYAGVARQALEVADHVIFVGPHAHNVLRARRSSRDTALQAFNVIDAAWEYLDALLTAGDLVLLKDSNCERLSSIFDVRKRHRPKVGQTVPAAEPSSESDTAIRSMFAVVGLGNPGERWQQTPHNVGHLVLDRLAARLGGQWVSEEQALTARVDLAGVAVSLVKPISVMNRTGPVVVDLAARLGVRASRCILVHDDADLGIGTVRGRMKGSAGGHRGVRSILESFRTDAVPRVKVGVGRPANQEELASHVLAKFDSSELPLVDKACEQAADRILQMLDEISRAAVV